MRFFSIILLFASVAWCTSCTTTESKVDKELPNIVLIMADDLGYNELSCYGQQNFTTPNIDRLASEGIKFTEFYAGNTVCGPSRCCFMTGKHPGRASVRGNMGVYNSDPIQISRVGISEEDLTIGETLKKSGYKTALCGKWHLEYFNDSVNTWPMYRGFDYVIRERWNSQINKERAEFRKKTGVIFDYNYPYELWENGKKKIFEGNIDGKRTHLMDDIVTEKGIQFIKENKDDPFFVMFSLKIPHNPETFEPDTGLFADKGWPECERMHAIRIKHMDLLVDKIVNTVDNMGLSENTMIVFTSDNGGHSEGGYLEPEVDPCKHDYTFFDSNYPLKLYKRDLYDGGIRVPMIVRWPGTIKSGQTTNHIGAFWDFMVTFADAAGDTLEYHHDGISFLPTLTGAQQTPHDHLYWEYFNPAELKNKKNFGFTQAVRMGKWKAVRYGVNNPVELYDLSVDISETTDLSSQYPEIVNQVMEIMQSEREENSLFPYGGGVNLNIEKDIQVISS